MRTVLVIGTALIVTPIYAVIILGSALIGIKYRDKGVFWWAPSQWCRWICRAAGARVITHGYEKLEAPTPRILAANHNSWFDVFALASTLPRYAFVAKAELAKIPLWGASARATGQVFIERDNRKAAFAVYEEAAKRIREGTTVVIFPEGTRGVDYRLRHFKKGPFVLAIASQAPVFPVIIHGSIEVQKKGSTRIQANDIHVHVLDPIPTEGMTYDDRDVLAQKVHDAMSKALNELYDIPRSQTHVPSPGPQSLS
jgi:1-acyl-sn-glycerol-3-phosphate acyltransferase